ncbi:nuclease, partial [Kluyveromyces marxianus]
YGFPGPIHDLETRQEFISCYDRKTRNPYWVVEHITPESLKARGGDRKNSVFKEDERIPDMSGYDRGHQAPAANAKFSQEAMDDTFYLTNMCPQVGEGFNRDYWAHLEYFCRQLVDKYNSVRIMTGPLYLPKKDPKDGKFRVTYEVIGNPPNVAVPTHFFKLVVAEKPKNQANSDELHVAAFVLPNEPISNSTKLTEFEVPVNALERSSGLQLLQNVPPNKKKELCKQVSCQITVREFNKQVLALPPPKDYFALQQPAFCALVAVSPHAGQMPELPLLLLPLAFAACTRRIGRYDIPAIISTAAFQSICTSAEDDEVDDEDSAA